MAEKKSFVMYADWENFLDVLTDEEKGRLLTALYAYFNRGEQPDLSGALKMAFIVMSQQFDRDREKWEKVCERNRKVAVSRWAKKKSTTGTTRTKNTDNDTEYDNDTDIVNETENENDTVIETENVNESESESETETEQSSCAYAPPAPAPAPAHKKRKKEYKINISDDTAPYAKKESRPSSDGLESLGTAGSYEAQTALTAYRESLARLLKEDG